MSEVKEVEKEEKSRYTFVMIKPDGFKKNVFKNVMEIFMLNGLSIMNVNVTKLDKELVKEHYNHLLDRDFYPYLEEFMLSGNVITMMVVGEDAVKKVRTIIGATNPKNAVVGTIRAMYGEDATKNVIHASDSSENAKKEMDRFNNYFVRKLKK